jgi:hypothetical protein
MWVCYNRPPFKVKFQVLTRTSKPQTPVFTEKLQENPGPLCYMDVLPHNAHQIILQYRRWMLSAKWKMSLWSEIFFTQIICQYARTPHTVVLTSGITVAVAKSMLVRIKQCRSQGRARCSRTTWLRTARTQWSACQQMAAMVQMWCLNYINKVQGACMSSSLGLVLCAWSGLCMLHASTAVIPILIFKRCHVSKFT